MSPGQSHNDSDIEKFSMHDDDEVLYHYLPIINDSSIKACNDINQFYKSSNTKFHKIVDQIEKSNII